MGGWNCFARISMGDSDLVHLGNVSTPYGYFGPVSMPCGIQGHVCATFRRNWDDARACLCPLSRSPVIYGVGPRRWRWATKGGCLDDGVVPFAWHPSIARFRLLCPGFAQFPKTSDSEHERRVHFRKNIQATQDSGLIARFYRKKYSWNK